MAVLAIGRRMGNPVCWCRGELTISEMLSDSIVKALMRADGIDAEVLEAELRSLARTLSAARHPPARAPLARNGGLADE